MTSSLSQRERLKPSLIPYNLSIEERDLGDWLILVGNLSREFVLYGFDDKPAGNWEPFFLRDPHLWSIIFSKMPVLELGTVYENLMKSFQTAETEGGAEGVFQSMVSMVSDSAARLDEVSKALGGQPSDVGLGNMAQFLTGNRVEIVEALRGKPREETLAALHTQFTDILTQFNLLRESAVRYLKQNPVLQGTYTPHLGLLITFLHLFRHLRAQINGLTREHLDCYYHRVLGIGFLPEVPDKVHLVFETDLNIARVPLTADTRLLAKVPGIKDPIPYRLTEDLVVNKAVVASLKTLFVSERPVFLDENGSVLLSNNQVYQASYPTPTPAQFLKSVVKAPNWPVFGEGQAELGEDQRTMDDARLGLALGSPLFFLTEGRREIQLTFYFEAASYGSLEDYLSTFAAAAGKSREAVLSEVMTHAWVIHYTFAAGWAPIDDYVVQLGEDSLTLLLRVSPESPAAACYNALVHGENYAATHPLLRLLINPENSHNAYSFFKGLVMERIQLRASVTGFRNVQLQNANGNLSAQSPFQPFGPLPFMGSYLDIRNTNVFNRYTTGVSVSLEWLELPKNEDGFTDYYKEYGTNVRTGDFRVSLGALSDGQCRPAAGQRQTLPLFAVDNVNGCILQDTTVLDGIDVKRLDITGAPFLDKDQASASAFFRMGTLRLELTGPPDAFGHALYPRIFPDVIQFNVRHPRHKQPLPNPPYTPKVKSISVDYTLEYAEAFREYSGGLEVIQLLPFGHRRVYPSREEPALSFIPVIEHAGNLHIGLSGLPKEGEVTLLFQLEESTFHHTLHTTETPIWSYLRDNTWVPFPGMYVLTDTTNRFINSGLIKIRIPNDINTRHHILPSGLTWLRVSVTGRADVRSRVIAVYTQAVLAQRVLSPATPPLERGFQLAPGSITEFAQKVRGIQQLFQVFPSFGGQPVETDSQYYTRVSERLRHKERPLTAPDIEQLVLQRFPSLSVVRCFGAGPGNPGVYPGVNLQVVVIPAPGPVGTSDQPKASLATLVAIKAALAGVLSPFVQVEVGNPVYERIKVRCSVRFAQNGVPGYADRGSFLKQLHEDLKQHICPWLYEEEAASQIGATLYLSEIMAFIKKRPYIAEVNAFTLIHFYEVKDPITGEMRADCTDTFRTPTDRISGSVREAILIPSDQHLITVLDEPGYQDGRRSGIGDFVLGRELLIVGDTSPRPTPPESDRMTDPDDEYFDLEFSI
ncbi:MAG TPA: hypothetical protein VL547_18470 [Dinghuibacter sp.]|uniref:hypothetical protein n=1 Tax=Dinghuibacter sp. TaxID=2024697 RepID=UPI002D0D4BF2|nr:hypothetical protein [Dinghuibacter sp.]HTJ14032.1 hypothetical protein [Dinghuibacter sp.]